MRDGQPPAWRRIVACALAMSLGWGIRGNFGHAYGALIPGALGAMAACLLAGREDWWRRVAYFGLFGALGWSFGGTVSYMRVIAYTHSGHLPSQAYGFACLFVIGFTWAALGGAGSVLPACLDRRRLTGLLPPLLAVLGAWLLQDLLVPFVDPVHSGARRHQSPLYWYDTSWLAALLAAAAVLVLTLVRWRVCWGTTLVLYLAAGWWVGFGLVVVLVDGLGLEFRMTPPRGDNWAGALGMTAGALAFCRRHGLAPVARAALVAGFWGGFGFVFATFLKLVEVRYVPPLAALLGGSPAGPTNWHSILEQTYGLVNGIGLGIAVGVPARDLPPPADGTPDRRWTAVAVAFVLLVIPYVNLVKDVGTWVQLQAIPAQLHGIPSRVWFDAGYVLLAAAVLVLLARHLRTPLPIVPPSALGQGQLLFVVFLWIMVLGNLLRAIPPFAEQRLVTEGVFHVNAVVCMLLVLLGPRPAVALHRPQRTVAAPGLWRIAAWGAGVLVLSVAVATAGTRLIHGGRFVGHAGYHTRFGPDAETGKPRAGQDHP